MDRSYVSSEKHIVMCYTFIMLTDKVIEFSQRRLILNRVLLW